MIIKRQKLEFLNTPESLCWDGNQLIDWVGGGSVYKLNEEFIQSGRRYAYNRLDSAVQFVDGDDYYAVIYEKLGTKGLVLKNTEIIREINRSYYQASVYEYPIVLLKLKDGEMGIAHCPDEYNILEIEYLETGERVITQKRDDPKDCFISRLRVNKCNTKMLNVGWVWHPMDILDIYDIEEGIRNPKEFDEWPGDFLILGDISSAEFLNDWVLISTIREGEIEDTNESDENKIGPGQIGFIDTQKDIVVKKVSIDFTTGTLIPINKDFAWSLYKYPKVVNLNSGEIVQKFEDINSGNQCSSIIHHIDKIPAYDMDYKNQRIAFVVEKGIEILSW